MIAWQDHDKRLLRYYFVFEIGFLFPAEESDIKLPALQVVCERCRMVARNPDFDIEQFVAKDTCSPRQPIDFLPGLEADGESRFDTLRRTPRRFHRGIRLRQRQPRMVEKGLACGGQLDAVNAARQQLRPDLVLQVANLPAQRRLGGVEPQLGGCCQAALLDHRHEITQVPQLHSYPMPERYAAQLTKSCSRPLAKPIVAAMETGS